MNMNEKEILNFLRKTFNPQGNNGLIGDDAALIQHHSGKKMLFTVDSLSENVHFKSNDSPYLIGKKLASVSLSDIAAMGGVPKYILISLAVDKKTNMAWIKKMYEGINTIIKEFNVKLIGGDTLSSKTKVLSSFVIGETINNALFRKGAKNGDMIYATGCFGQSFKTKHHFNFTPRVNEIKWLINKVEISALTDASDGLFRSLELLTVDNKLGAEIYSEKIPLRIDKNGKKSLKGAFFDGEDFELIFTSNNIEQTILNKFEKKFNIPINLIGKVTCGGKIKIFQFKKEISLKGKYFEHFK